ncbi:1-phosphofructokinase family hexose kinase [Paenibacillus sp. 7124]|uniref:Tagatose-6-phosphate kinase n=1 Tax=Paenibacillus apii TaxID=1850370 RepID=A0A6M1PN34_9BACL|nr:1-phosphofructokinase family hexose kinase [Paenibacillus apii]NGM84606.1 1-phosphofructokinase family hexose kinase [Paenibacillus apii]NJJ40275.1 1-phosphofructokinase family hexose kinase [Paenibacillus apii]
MIVTLTVNPSVDASTAIKQVVPDHKLRCREATYQPGGGGVNVSRAIHRLGGKALALYTSGGLHGQLIHQMLEQEGVEHQSIPIQGQTRENLIVLEESTGQQFRFDMPGPAFGEEDRQRCLDQLNQLKTKPDYLVLSGSLPPGCPADYYAQIIKSVKDWNCRVIVDTSGEALQRAADAGVYLLKPNARELEELTGMTLSGDDDVKAAAEKLIAEGRTEAVIVSLGAKGAFMISKEGAEHISAPKVPVVSVVGAGDSLVAGVVYRLEQGGPLAESVRFGIAAGAAAVMNPERELCKREDTERLFESMMQD